MPQVQYNLELTPVPVDPTKLVGSHGWLQSFVSMLQKILQRWAVIINGNLSFGDGVESDNISGAWVSVSTPGTPNTDFTVTHNLGRIPVGYLPMSKAAATDVYTGSVPATATQLTLRATATGVAIKLFIFSLLLFLSTVPVLAQGVRLDGIAVQTKTTNTGFGQITYLAAIPSAGVTVCAGSTVPAPGVVCSPTTTVYTNIT